MLLFLGLALGEYSCVEYGEDFVNYASFSKAFLE
jgi:hypothetical protein